MITLDPGDLATPDWSRLRELPPGTRVYGVPRSPTLLDRLERMAWIAYRSLRSVAGRRAAPSPAGSTPTRAAQPEPSRPRAGLGAARRAYYAWLEYARDRRWARRVAALGGRLVGADGDVAVISCGPPHMAHWAGRLVAERTNAPHVLDLRDPWSLVERLADDIDSPVWLWHARRYERMTVAPAALIVMNTEPARRAMQRVYPHAAHRIITVTNGYDADELVATGSTGGRFRIVFAGSVYIDRDPRLLLRAAAILVKDLRLTPADFEIEFVGSPDGASRASIVAMARDEGIEQCVTVTGFRPRRELRAVLGTATLLVSLNQDSNLAIPSKIFEYMQYPAGLVALAEPGSATELLLRGTAADVVPPADTAALAHALRRRYLQHQRGEAPARLSAEPRFNRRVQATALFDAIADVTARTSTAPREAVLAEGTL